MACKVGRVVTVGRRSVVAIVGQVQHVGQTSEHGASRASDNGSDFHSTKREAEDVRNDLK
jgi:hypothetical protein